MLVGRPNVYLECVVYMTESQWPYLSTESRCCFNLRLRQNVLVICAVQIERVDLNSDRF